MAFPMFDNAFSKSVTDRYTQCDLINTAQQSCSNAQQNISNIAIPKNLDNEINNLLIEAKTDAKNSVDNWNNIFSQYNNQCISDKLVNPTEIKLQLVSAVKSKYLMELKVKKAKNLIGLK
jgi:hypothetical protein